MPKKKRSKPKQKPGPQEERLIITEDPQQALDRLLRPTKTQPPKK